jgi:hypothetical protein
LEKSVVTFKQYFGFIFRNLFCTFVPETPKMQLRTGKILSFLVVFLIIFETVGAAATVLSVDSNSQSSLHSKKPVSSVMGSLLFEKAEEETEKAEEEKDGTARTVLVDFSHIAFSLSYLHSHHHNHPARPALMYYNVRPAMHAFNCVFLI